MIPSQISRRQDLIPASNPSFLPADTFVFWGWNVLTLGIYTSLKQFSLTRQVRELINIQEVAKARLYNLNESWNNLEIEIKSKLDQIIKPENYKHDIIKRQLAELSHRVDLIQVGKQLAGYPTAITVKQIALEVIQFLGSLLFNAITLGFYGIYKNYRIKNKIVKLEEKNGFLNSQYRKKLKKFKFFQKIIVLSENFLKIHFENEIIKETDHGRELARRNEFACTQLQTEKDLLIAEKKRIANLTHELSEIKINKAKILELEEKVAKLTQSLKFQPEALKLVNEMRVLPPKYQRRPEDPGVIPGAIDLGVKIVRDPREIARERAQGSGKLKERSQDKRKWIEFCEGYRKRYGDEKVTASEIAESSFNYACKTLYTMRSEGKIKINNSKATHYMPCALAVYRFMALDFLKGGKLVQEDCDGFEIQINTSVRMLASQPKILIELHDDGFNEPKPMTTVRHMQRDDFTPREDIIGRDGVDPISAKWILAQLTEEEEGHLFNLLMSVVIENDHEEYKKTLEFMRANDERAQLIRIGYDLIATLGDAYKFKFGQTVFAKCWPKYANEEHLNPFYKAEDIVPDARGIPDVGMIPPAKSFEVSDWVLDIDVLSDNASQNDFAELIQESSQAYQKVFTLMPNDLVVQPEMKQESKIERKGKILTWEELNRQYHSSHCMLGKQRCLFSNLLAIFVTNQEDLTEDNVKKLKKAMAAYLDKLLTAKVSWEKFENENEKISSVQLTTEMAQLKEMADRAKIFETGILSHHQCSVADYQAWLREEARNEWFHEEPRLNYLSTFEIQLCAYTMGVQIGVYPVTLNCKTGIDEYGRIVPSEESYYGPKTKECFFMACNNDGTRPGGGSFYGLFSKLNIHDNPKLSDKPNLAALNRIENYWQINTKKHHSGWF